MKILRALERGEGRAEDIEQLSKLTRDLWIGKTFCAHAPGAMEPLMSALKYFRSEFEQGIAPARVVNVQSNNTLMPKISAVVLLCRV